MVELVDGRWAVVASGRALPVDAELVYAGRAPVRAHAAGGAVEPGLSALRVSAPAANRRGEVEVWSDGVAVADADVTPPDRDGAWSAAVRLSPRTG